MTNLKTSAELKAIARERSIEKYGTLIAADIIIALIQIFIVSISTFSSVGSLAVYIINVIIALIINILLGILVSGKAYLYMNLIYSQTVSVSDIFFGFKKFPNKAVCLQALFVIADFVAGLPATILLFMYQQAPTVDLMSGVILAFLVELLVNIYVRLTYSQAFYLLHDFPDRSAKELLATSRRLMKGNLFKLFYLHVSFIPLQLLGAVTLFIPLLWINVYKNGTLAAFYQDLIRQAAGSASADDAVM